MTYTNNTNLTAGNTYAYYVIAVNTVPNPDQSSAPSNTASVTVPGAPAVPAAPSNLTAARGPNQGNQRRVILNWIDNSNNETGFTIQRVTNAAFTNGVNTVTVAANTTTLTQTGLSRNTAYYYRIRANNGPVLFLAWVNATPLPIITAP